MDFHADKYIDIEFGETFFIVFWGHNNFVQLRYNSCKWQ